MSVWINVGLIRIHGISSRVKHHPAELAEDNITVQESADDGSLFMRFDVYLGFEILLLEVLHTNAMRLWSFSELLLGHPKEVHGLRLIQHCKLLGFLPFNGGGHSVSCSKGRLVGLFNVHLGAVLLNLDDTRLENLKQFIFLDLLSALSWLVVLKDQAAVKVSVRPRRHHVDVEVVVVNLNWLLLLSLLPSEETLLVVLAQLLELTDLKTVELSGYHYLLGFRELVAVLTNV